MVAYGVKYAAKMVFSILGFGLNLPGGLQMK